MNRTVAHVTIETPQRTIPKKQFSSEPRPSGRYGLDSDSDDENTATVSLEDKMKLLSIERIHNSSSVEYNRSLKQSRQLYELAQLRLGMEKALQEKAENTSREFDRAFREVSLKSLSTPKATPDPRAALRTTVTSSNSTEGLEDYKSPERYSSLAAYHEYINIVHEVSLLAEQNESDFIDDGFCVKEEDETDTKPSTSASVGGGKTSFLAGALAAPVIATNRGLQLSNPNALSSPPATTAGSQTPTPSLSTAPASKGTSSFGFGSINFGGNKSLPSFPPTATSAGSQTLTPSQSTAPLGTSSFSVTNLISGASKPLPTSSSSTTSKSSASTFQFTGFGSGTSLFSKAPSAPATTTSSLFSQSKPQAANAAPAFSFTPLSTLTSQPSFTKTPTSTTSNPFVSASSASSPPIGSGASESTTPSLQSAKRSPSMFAAIIKKFSNLEKSITEEIAEFTKIMQGSLVSAGRRWIRERITVTMQHSSDAKRIASCGVAFTDAYETGCLDDFDGPIDFASDPNFDKAMFQSWLQWNVITVYLAQLNEDPVLYKAVLESLAHLTGKWPEAVNVISIKLFSSSLILRFDYEALESLISTGRRSARELIYCEAAYVRLLLQTHLLAKENDDPMSGTSLIELMLTEIVQSKPVLLLTPVLVNEFTKVYGPGLLKNNRKLFMDVLHYGLKVVAAMKNPEEGANEVMVGFSAQYTEDIHKFVARFDTRRQQKTA